MDIRRVRLNDERTATVLSNDLIRAVIEDKSGRLVAFSAMDIHGGWVNANKLHQFPFSRETALQNQLTLPMTCELLDQLNGYRLQVEPVEEADREHTGPDSDSDTAHVATGPENSTGQKDGQIPGPKENQSYDQLLLGHEDTAAKETKETDAQATLLDKLYDRHRASWVVERYGSDFKTGAVWMLSRSGVFKKSDNWRAERLDTVFPNQPVIYSVLYITNVSLGRLYCDIGYDNAIAPPFLESGCQLNSSCNLWHVTKHERCFGCNGHIIADEKGFPLDKVPLATNMTMDFKTVPGMLGTTDAIYAENDLEADEPIWSSVINPRLQMIYLSFTLGKADRTAMDIPLHDATMLFDYGGRTLPPWALYEGGTSNEFCLHTGACTSSMGRRHGVVIGSGETRRMMFARALTSYDNMRMNGNFSSFEAFKHNIVLKRTRSTILIPSDPHFTQVQELAARLLAFPTDK